MIPGGWVGPQWRKPFLHVFIWEKIFSPEPAGQFQSKLVHIVLGIKGHVFLKGEIMTKMQK
jgi:hypothetical protein